MLSPGVLTVLAFVLDSNCFDSTIMVRLQSMLKVIDFRVSFPDSFCSPKVPYWSGALFIPSFFVCLFCLFDSFEAPNYESLPKRKRLGSSSLRRLPLTRKKPQIQATLHLLMMLRIHQQLHNRSPWRTMDLVNANCKNLKNFLHCLIPNEWDPFRRWNCELSWNLCKTAATCRTWTSS
jgi:hypothetical protein